MTFNELVKQWNGKWGIPNPTNQNSEGLKGQCVSLARYYIRNVLEIPLDGISGDAKDYWYRRNQSPLNKYFDAIPYTKGMSFKKGDIFILGPVSDNPYGHIGLCFGESNQSQMHIFDSNYKNQRICLDRWRGYDGMLGVLRPNEYLQSKIGGNVQPIKTEFKEAQPVLIIDKVTGAGYYNLRDKEIDGEVIYKAKKGDYFVIKELTNIKLSDGYYWYKVLSHGGDEMVIQFDPEYMHTEVWTK